MSQLTPDDITALRILARLNAAGIAQALNMDDWGVILPSGATLDADEATALTSFYADGSNTDGPETACSDPLEHLRLENTSLRMDNATLRAECDAQAETIKHLRRVATRRWWHRFRRARPDAS